MQTNYTNRWLTDLALRDNINTDSPAKIFTDSYYFNITTIHSILAYFPY
jgi:hypothetical protein